MMRSEKQRVILPRNWIFGRLAYIRNNLSSLIYHDKKHFTEQEYEELKLCVDKLNKIIGEKSINSSILKTKINEKNTLVR